MLSQTEFIEMPCVTLANGQRKQRLGKGIKWKFREPQIGLAQELPPVVRPPSSSGSTGETPIEVPDSAAPHIIGSCRDLTWCFFRVNFFSFDQVVFSTTVYLRKTGAPAVHHRRRRWITSVHTALVHYPTIPYCGALFLAKSAPKMGKLKISTVPGPGTEHWSERASTISRTSLGLCYP